MYEEGCSGVMETLPYVTWLPDPCCTHPTRVLPGKAFGDHRLAAWMQGSPHWSFVSE